MGYFPFYTDVTKLHGVIIGGGNIALEKVSRLMQFDAHITLIAREICDDIKEYSNALELIEAEYKSDYLDMADYVIAATDIRELNEQIYEDAKKRKLLINVVDEPDICDFIFPSVIQRGKLVIGISSSGAGPQVAINLRKEIEKIIPNNIEEILDYLAEERITAKQNIPDQSKRRKYLIDLAEKMLGTYEE